MLEAGKVLQNRYLVESQIGQGGMGAVYRATDQRFGSVVAIKETFSGEANIRKAFEREAKLLNSLRHVSLPKVSDFFIDGDEQFLVMEYIAGDDLFEMLDKRNAAFPFSEVQTWTLQLLDALNYLHSQESPIVHRDIKPQNLKLTAAGQIVLLDFGLAKGKPNDAGSKLTAAGSIFGYSRTYAALEQIQGTGTDPRSDIYSLGATLFHLATNKTPPDALTRATAVLNGEPDPLKLANLYNHHISPIFAEVLHRAMSLNANTRPKSATEMRRMIFESERGTFADADRTLELSSSSFQTEQIETPTSFLNASAKTFPDEKLPVLTNIQTEILPVEAPKKFSPNDTGNPIYPLNTEIGTAKTEILPVPESVSVITMPKPEPIISAASAKENSVSTDEVSRSAFQVNLPAREKSFISPETPKNQTLTKTAGAIAGVALLGAIGFGGWYASNNYSGASVLPANSAPANVSDSSNTNIETDGDSGIGTTTGAKNTAPTTSTVKPGSTPKKLTTSVTKEPIVITEKTPVAEAPPKTTEPKIVTPPPTREPEVVPPPMPPPREYPPNQPPPNPRFPPGVKPEDVPNMSPQDKLRLKIWRQKQMEQEKMRRQKENGAPPPNFPYRQPKKNRQGPSSNLK